MVAGDPNAGIQLVTFKLGAEEYGIDIAQVQEIIRPVSIVRVPSAPDFVEGVIDLRGKVLPIVDMRKRLGLSDYERTGSSRIIVTSVNGVMVGLVVDSVSEVIRMEAKAVEPLPEVAANTVSGFLIGIGKIEDRLIILVDLAKVLSASEARGLDALQDISSQVE